MNIQEFFTSSLRGQQRFPSDVESRRLGRVSKSKFSAKLRTRKLAIESLEARKLMAAEIFGMVYEDLDRNGIKSAGDNGLPGWTVFLDLNKNNALDAGEPSRVTDANGDYSFAGIAAGSYRVAEQLKTGWTATSPTSNDVTVADTKKIRSDFFVFAGGDIKGTVWNDLNDNGSRDSTDPGLTDWTVFLDLNVNLVKDVGEPSTLTAADGSYQFLDLKPGDYEVIEVLPTGWEPAKRNDSKQTAKVAALQVTTQDFGNRSFTNGGIQGSVFNDLNADGIRNINPATGKFSEPGLEGWTVYVDLNLNNIKDASDLSTLTDSDGEYSFLSLLAGDYEVIEVLPAGWDVSPTKDVKQTVAVTGGNVTVASDFANFTVLNGSISGKVWNDLNRNGVRDFNTLTGQFTDPPIAGWRVYIDLNRNRIVDAGEPAALTDSNGVYSFLDLQVGEYEVQEVLPAGWEVAPTFNDSNPVIVFSGSNTTAPDFANFDASASAPGSVSGVVWNDLNSNGIHEAAEPGLIGWTVFLDQNSDGLLTAGERQVITPADGSYTFAGVSAGTVSIGILAVAGWNATFPASNSRTVTLRGGQDLTALDFGRAQLRDSSISGLVFADSNKNGLREATEHGLAGITVYIDVNNNNVLDAAEPSTVTSVDEFYTPTIDEAGSYSFTHLAQGTYIVRAVVPAVLSATPAAELSHTITIVAAENRTGVNTAAVYRPNEIHGLKFDDLNGNHVRDAGEPVVPNATIFVDLNRNNVLDAGEPTTHTLDDGTYTFTGLPTGTYVIRELVSTGHTQTYPTTTGGILWPTGTSNPAVGIVTPTSITTSLAQGDVYRTNVSITLPNTGALTNLVDVFLLFDDTGSFVNNSPIVRAAFPDIIARLNASLPGINLGFGVGRFEEYANFASEYSSGRPFVLNQPIVAASTAGYLTSIQAALNRTAPGYGGDQPETDIEALFQLVTGKGFDGNNNGAVLDSGRAGLASTQINPGPSGDVPSFASFTADPANSVMPAAGNVGGAGFRSGALPIVLLATDTGFAYQPKGETSVTGVGGLNLPLSALTQTSRPTTPFNSGAGIQETITGLNALGALVIGLGTNPGANVDPRQQLESISKLTGTTNRTTTTIANGTTDPIAPGDPLYFQIASGFGTSVANGVVSAIQNAVTNVAVDIEVRASDPRVHLTSVPGIRTGIGSGMTAAFDIEIVGDGAPRRFDLQFVRAGTNVVLGSIPVVLGTPIEGDGYHYDELDDGEIEIEDDFGDHSVDTGLTNMAPSFVKGTDKIVIEDAGANQYVGWATAISPGGPSESGQVVNFIVSSDNLALFSSAPAISPAGSLTFTSAANANGVAIISVRLHDNGGTANGGVDTSAPQTFTITVTPVNDAPIANNDSYTTNEDTPLAVVLPGVLANDSDIDSTVLTAVLVSGPTHGTVSVNANGSFNYQPASNYFGADSFTYKVNDGTLDSNIGTVSLVVRAINDAPIATDDTYSTNEDTNLVVAVSGVLGNDVDIDSALLTSLLVLGPTHGTIALNSNGSFTYVPAANYNGSDSFTYKANDGALDSNVATARITVVSINDAPIAINDSFSVTSGVATLIAAPGVLTNDTDVDTTVLTSVLVTGPTHGSVVLNPNGSFSYTSTLGYVGPDSFTYKANDGSLDSNIAQVSITVSNLPPVAVDDAYSTMEDTTLVVPVAGVLANDTDPDSTSLTSMLVLSPAHGIVTLNSNGSFTYVPTANYNGSDSFTYKANDGLLNSNIATVRLTVTAVNDAPVAVNDNYTASSGVAKTIAAPGVLQNDTDIDTAVLTSDIVSPPSHGTVTLNANGSFTYRSTPGYVGTDVFTYVASDGALKSNIAQVSIAVSPVENNIQFLVVDETAKQTFRYGTTGTSVSQSALNKENKKGRGIATSSDGTSWVVDGDGVVYVYGATGASLGSFRVNGIDKPEGITISGKNLWIVDNETDRVYLCAGALTRRSGTVNPTSSFPLDRANRNPRDIATDGDTFWVVNDTSNVDRVFRYSSEGRLQGSWTIDVANSAPTGLAIDPSNLNNVWIADSGTDRVYQYDAGATRTEGKQSASRSFALNSLDGDPQGISIKSGAASKESGFIAMTLVRVESPTTGTNIVDRQTLSMESKTDSARYIDTVGQLPRSMVEIHDEVLSEFNSRSAMSTDLELVIDEIVIGKAAKLRKNLLR